MASYVLNIDGVVDLTEEIENIKLESKIPSNSNARSGNHEMVLTIDGRVSFDVDKVFMKDNMKELANWSIVPPSSPDSYKKTSLQFEHAGAVRKYELSHAFVLSFTETYGPTDGKFILVLKQKADRGDGVTIE